MILWSAGAFLLLASAKNRVRSQLRRLREPRYLVGMAAALLWFGTVLFRRAFTGEPAPASSLPYVELGLMFMATIAVAGSWVMGGDEAAIKFTEAEVQYLFPAPVSRRALLHYKLVRTLALTVISAAFTTLLVGFRVTAHPGYFFAGAWIALATLGLHLIAASLTRAMLVERGVGGWRRRVVTVVALGVVVGLIVAGGRRVGPFPDQPDLEPMARWVIAATSTAPASWVLVPLRLPLAVALAQDLRSFVAALPGALVLLAVHYAWAMSTGVAFEEASLVAAERSGRRLETLRSQQGLPITRARPLFRLAGVGRPEVAFVWKSTIAGVRTMSLRLSIALAFLGVAAGLLAAGALGPDHPRLVVLGFVAFAYAGWLCLLGPQALRLDLRLDLPLFDVVRTWPLSGARVVRGAIAGPALLLSIGEIGFLLVGTALTAGEGPLGPAQRVALATAACLWAPGLTVCGLVVQNAGLLLFPAWASTGRGPVRGFEQFGQRLLLLFGNLLVLFVVGLPAGLVMSLVTWLASPLGVGAVVLGSVASAGVIAAEAWLATGVLGGWYERFEPPE